MSGLRSLRRLAEPRPAAEPSGAAEERCELCAVPMGERHGHVADVEEHRLLCVCRPCYLLFAPDGAGGGRFKGVGEVVRRVAGPRLDHAAWDALRVPVDLVFFLRQTGVTASTAAGGPLAFYPGPGGATESLLDLSAWDDIVGANPVLGTAVPDVEAVLLRRREEPSEVTFACYVVPIDLCYELVGTVRTWWTGLGGGPEVRLHLDQFFEALDARARLVPPDGEP